MTYRPAASAGREMWSGRPFQQVMGLEVLGAILAVYGQDGTCAAVEPRTGRVWEFRPPPGRVRVRKPEGADPVVVHVAGSAITVFSGYRRKLDVVWHYECGAEITAFDTDGSACAVVALAGEKLYRVETGRGS